jgi:hypothetical protein
LEAAESLRAEEGVGGAVGEAFAGVVFGAAGVGVVASVLPGHSFEGASYGEGACVEVDVVPVEGEDFAASKTERDGDHPGCAVGQTFGCGEHPLCFVDGERLDLGTEGARECPRSTTRSTCRTGGWRAGTTVVVAKSTHRGGQFDDDRISYARASAVRVGLPLALP